MDAAAVKRTEQPSSGNKAALADKKLPYLHRLALRPWETPLAQCRLNVPHRLFPENCPVVTRWTVLTGATCAGKTTLVQALELLGFPVVHEVARAYVIDEHRKGRAVAAIRADDHNFRQKVFELTQHTELGMLNRAHQLIFLDRSAIDSISFHRGSGYDPHEILEQLRGYRYGAVFHCSRLPFKSDGLRTANEDRRHFLDASLERDYRALQYSPIRIPQGTVEERITSLLRHCGCELSDSQLETLREYSAKFTFN